MKKVILSLNLMTLSIFSLYSEVTYSNFSIAPALWPTRFTGQGLVGNQHISGFIDGMQPLIGNNSQLWFLDGSILGGSGDFHTKNAVYSIGTGFRQLTNFNQDPITLGGFFFADYQKTANRTQAWIANPGIELLSQYNEARIQGYIPLSQASQPYRRNLLASQIRQINFESSQNINHFNYVQGHSYFDTPVSLTDEYGTGVEAELGHYFPWYQGGWIRGGVYYFHFNHAKEITGVEANIELLARENAALIIQDNYDNQNKNKFSVGIRFSFDGFNYGQIQPISNRMQAPIIRHLARQYEGLGTPIRKSFKPTSPTQVITNNIWFFSPNGTYQGHGMPVNLLNCTAENPCLNLDQTLTDGIATIAPQAQLWFAPGTYTLPSTGNNGFIQLADGQTLWGRTGDFINPASYNNLPNIVGGLWWNGSGQLSNLRVINFNQIIPQNITNAYNDTVMGVGAAANLTLNNVQVITTASGGPADTAIFSIYSNNKDSNILINSSQILAIGQENYTGYVDTVVSDNGNIVINNSYIVSTGTGTQQNNAILAIGSLNMNDSIVNVGGATLNGSTGAFAFNVRVNNSQITVNDTDKNSGGVFGIYAANNASVNHSIINVNGNAYTNGILAVNNAVVNYSLVNVSGVDNTFGISTGKDSIINNSIINTTANGLAHAVDSVNSTISNSQIYVKSNSDNEAIGVIDYTGEGTIKISNSFISAENTLGGLATGVKTSNGEIIFTGGASQVFAQANDPSMASPTIGTVINSSTPKSQCSTNGVVNNC
ncbi:hypothetical protein ACNVED_04015 [Legionella sp. D16C41]|uniref:hypothetical protein n=1 Tax=Legionella sp. D16C41 TaxID=3402688 RepID=UPI003AF6B21F